MQTYIFIGLIIILFLGYIDIRLILVKIDLENYIENRPKGKSPNATKSLKKTKWMIRIIWLTTMAILGVISYLYGRYIIVG